jgi:hypothetical protein
VKKLDSHVEFQITSDSDVSKVYQLQAQAKALKGRQLNQFMTVFDRVLRKISVSIGPSDSYGFSTKNLNVKLFSYYYDNLVEAFIEGINMKDLGSNVGLWFNPELLVERYQNHIFKQLVKLRLVNYFFNPYMFSPDAAQVTTSIFSVMFHDSDLTDIPIENLTTPIALTIPVDASMKTGGNPEFLRCQFYNASKKYPVYNATNRSQPPSWVPDPGFDDSGCSLYGMEQNFMICLCNHMTDFAGAYKMAPQLQIANSKKGVYVSFDPWDEWQRSIGWIIMIVISSIYGFFWLIFIIFEWPALKRKETVLENQRRRDDEKTKKEGNTISSLKNLS